MYGEDQHVLACGQCHQQRTHQRSFAEIEPMCLLGIDELREQYRRGLVDTERQNDDDSRNQYQAYREKFRLLEAPEV